MGGNSVKTIVMLMVLVVLSFIIGAQVTDNLKDSVGAFVVIGCVVVLFLLLWMGKNSWWLMFLLPPVLGYVPLPYVDASLASMAISVVIFTYHYIQCKSMGYARLHWHSCAIPDMLMVCLLCYMALSYYRFPVSIEALNIDLDYVGGQPYVYAVGALLYYLFISMLDAKQKEWERLIRWAFYLQVAGMLIGIVVRFKTGQIYWAEEVDESISFADAAGERRITVFSQIGFFLLAFCFASRPLSALFRSPLYMGGILLSMGGIALTGARNQLVQSVLYVSGIAVLKRELAGLVFAGIIMWIALLGLGRSGAFAALPYTTLRFIAMVPGVEVSGRLAVETQGSSEVRLVAWKQALDPKSGYIKNYVWGDGFQLSRRAFLRGAVARMRGTAQGVNSHSLAETGNWHNGFIYTMHRLGLVGCALFYLIFISGIVLFFRAGTYYHNKPFFPYFCAYSINCFVFPFVYSYNSRTPVHFFSYLIGFSLLKLMYTVLRETGEIPPFSLSRHYTPMSIQELEKHQGVSSTPLHR